MYRNGSLSKYILKLLNLRLLDLQGCNHFNPCIVLGGVNIDYRLRVRGVECVLTLTLIVSMNTY